MTLHHYEHLVRKARNRGPRPYRFEGDWLTRPERWHEAWLDKLRELLEPWPEPVTPEPQWQTLEERAHHTLYRVTYATEPGLETFALVAIPHQRHEPMPGVLWIHGHQRPRGCYRVLDYRKDAESEADVRANDPYSAGCELADAGCCVFAPNLRGFGDRLTDVEYEAYTQSRRDPCDVTFFQQMLLGEVAITGQLHELDIALSILGALPQVDEQRLACTGMSYGGRLTMFLTALDPRIKAAAVGGALNTFAERIESYASCGYQVVPGLLKYADTPEVFGLAAPRPLAVDLGASDGTSPREPGLAIFQQIQTIYRAFGCEQRCQLFTHDGGHVYHRQAMIPWLLEQLAVDQEPSSTAPPA